MLIAIKVLLMLTIFTNPLNYPHCVAQFFMSCYTWKQGLDYNLRVYQQEMSLRNEGFVTEDEEMFYDFMYHMNPYNREDHPSGFPYDDQFYDNPSV